MERTGGSEGLGAYASQVQSGFSGHLGGSVGEASDLSSGHDLTVCESKSRIG